MNLVSLRILARMRKLYKTIHVFRIQLTGYPTSMLLLLFTKINFHNLIELVFYFPGLGCDEFYCKMV